MFFMTDSYSFKPQAPCILVKTVSHELDFADFALVSMQLLEYAKRTINRKCQRVNKLLILNMKKFVFIMSKLIKWPTMQVVLNNIVLLWFCLILFKLTLLCDM